MARLLKAILFDIDDTLIATTEFAERARKAAIRKMIRYGLDVPEDEAFHELKEVINEFSSNYPHHFDKLLLRFPAAWKSVNPVILVAAGIIGYHQTKSRELKPYPEVLEVFEILSKTPLLLGIISAGLAVKQAEKLIRLHLYPFLDPEAIFISDQIGISKPNVKLYQKACHRLGLPPDQVMYVGDHPEKDIDPANRLGMITVRTFQSSRHRNLKGETAPNYEIDNFHELLDILKRDFLIEPESAGGTL